MSKTAHFRLRCDEEVKSGLNHHPHKKPNKSSIIKTMKYSYNIIFIITIACFACNPPTSSKNKSSEAPAFQNKGHELVYQLVQKTGDYQDLLDKKDVTYTYTYRTPDGKTDISNEKYIFDGELSYGHYTKHERTLTDLEGEIEQGYDGQGYWLKNDGTVISDTTHLKRVAFNRPTNFYWFAMFPKLLDPGLLYEHKGVAEFGGIKYDVVDVTFDPKDPKPRDIYQVHINQESGLADQFLFTVADFGLVETPLLMEVKYEEVDGILIPSDRRYKRSTWEADVSEDPWITVTWTDIRFDTGLDKSLFMN